jgi:rod shape-determining protein MreC
MWLDGQYRWFQPIRYGVAHLLVVPQQVSLLPGLVTEWLGESASLRRELLRENKQLAARNFILESKAMRIAALEAENIELRELLSASEQLDARVLVTSVNAVDPDPFSQEIMINKGAVDNVFVGQPVVDSYGLLGQVVDVSPLSSRVQMIADSNHAIPVQVNRNGVRAIATGTGLLNELTLIYVPNTADIKVGDNLVSSGLGGRYPRGYPVGQVNQVERQAGKKFAKVTATPASQMDRSRHLLLLFTDVTSPVPNTSARP